MGRDLPRGGEFGWTSWKRRRRRLRRRRAEWLPTPGSSRYLTGNRGEFDARVRRILDGRLRGLRQENERLREMAAAAETARQREQEAQLQAAMEFAVIRARQQMAQAIASGGSRVAENGGRRRSVSRWDPRGLSGAELAAIRKRVQDGEKIRF